MEPIQITPARQEGREQGAVLDVQVLEELKTVAFGAAGDDSGSRLKYSSKLKALEMLCKISGLLDKKTAADPDAPGQTGVVLMPTIEQEP